MKTYWLLAALCVIYAGCALRFDAIHLPFCDEGWLAESGMEPRPARGRWRRR